MEAEVLFEYEKTQEDELTLKPGDIIHNVKEVDDGWCEGELNGVCGMFPDNFVKLRPATAPAPAAPAPEASTVQLRNTDQSKKTRRARVTFSYLADNADELSLQPGQVVEVLEEEEEGWWKGRIGNQEGVFPSNFVEEIAEEETPKAEPSKPQPPRHTSPEAPPPVDSQTGERHPPTNGDMTDTGGHKPGGVRGPMVMPSFDPSKIRAGLKKSTVAPPLEKPPEHKKAAPPPGPTQSQPPKPSGKPVEQAKVTYEYEADNDDELTIRVGDIVDIINKEVDQQDGWWEVSLRGKRGLIPDNFVEVLPAAPPPQPASASPPQPKHIPAPASQPKTVPSKPPPPSASKDPIPPATSRPPPKAKKAPAPAPQAKSEPSPAEDQSDFPVPKTTPLDTSAMKDRPKNKNRPPSRSNLLNHEPEPSPAPATTEESPPTEPSKNLSPWQAELIKKKKQPVKAPKPKPSTGSKPEPPAAAKPIKPAAVKPAQPPKAVETKPPPPQDTPSQSEPPSSSAPHSAAAPPTDNAWKEAYEKLREEFDKFKEHVTRELQILTDDLDKERKHRAGMDIDIDRLKKAQRALK